MTLAHPPFFSRRPALALALALALPAPALSACGRSPEKAEAVRERVVLVAPVDFGRQNQARELVAAIRPRVESDLAFRVTGKLVRRLAETGQRVTAGDVLAMLDDADLRLQKEQADAELLAARAALEQTAAEERRAAKLRQEGWATQAALELKRAAAAEARGRFERAKRAAELAQNSLDYASLKAEADGVVTAAFVEPGQVVAAGKPAFRLARAGELEAAVALPEAFAAAAGAGEARLVLWSRPGVSYRARVRELSPSADPATGTFAARFSILDPDPAIALGMSATLHIEKPMIEAVAAVPLSALLDQGEGPGVWRVDAERRLSFVPVGVKRYETKMALVTGGLKDGDHIVILGAHKLEAGEKVRPLAADAPPERPHGGV